VTSTFQTLEKDLYRTFNVFVEPAVRLGCASPAIVLTGLIVLETIGRRTGRARRVPLLAMLIEGHVLVSTLRGNRSQWIRNLATNPHARYWLGGQVREAEALVYAPNQAAPDTSRLPPAVRCVTAGLAPAVRDLGWTFALLVPRRPDALSSGRAASRT